MLSIIQLSQTNPLGTVVLSSSRIPWWSVGFAFWLVIMMALFVVFSIDSGNQQQEQHKADHEERSREGHCGDEV